MSVAWLPWLKNRDITLLHDNGEMATSSGVDGTGTEWPSPVGLSLGILAVIVGQIADMLHVHHAEVGGAQTSAIERRSGISIRRGDSHARIRSGRVVAAGLLPLRDLDVQPYAFLVLLFRGWGTAAHGSHAAHSTGYDANSHALRGTQDSPGLVQEQPQAPPQVHQSTLGRCLQRFYHRHIFHDSGPSVHHRQSSTATFGRT